ncbi:MAG: hypothetical protein QHI38_06555 [Armatimonadota bacterium]|nr:hypothetical protein [Armatimonadota bacterium]
MGASFQTEYLELRIRPNGTVGFIDRHTGTDYALPNSPIAFLRVGDKTYSASEAFFDSGKLRLRFGECGAEAAIAVITRKDYLVFEVLSVSGQATQQLTFVDVATKLRGSLNEPFVACALALNLKTNVPALPGPMSHLSASCYAKTGLNGAAAAIVGCPPAKLREVMQEVVRAAPELPKSPVGGPWALDSAANRGSYLFNFGGLTEQTVDSWIDLAKSLGITQIDFHGGASFRFGDCRPNLQWYPKGRESFKAVIDRLHTAGILAGLHTYAFFIDKTCPWVTPIPDPGLAKDAAFTLAVDLSEDAEDVPVVESTENMSAVTGFFVRNSVTLQIDDELITYTGVAKEPPYKFTGCKRGAYGTRVSPHSKGAKVYHLKECFGLFAPDPDSELFTKVVEATADFYNECGFDMIYLDALDGEDVLGGSDWGWHYGSKFVFELFRRLKKPPIMEMSTFHHHLWYVRSRMGAWDHPRRSHKRFIDLHCQANKSCLNMFMPAHLGWWAIIADSNPQVEPTFSDDIEYLCAKCAGWDCGLSPQGFTPESYASSYNLKRLGSIIKRWESLRLAGWFSETAKSRLREPRSEFTLDESQGRPELREAQYWKHKILGTNTQTYRWNLHNPHSTQVPRIRIEALMSAQPYDSPEAVTLVDFNDPQQFQGISSAPGIEAAYQVSKDVVKIGSASAHLTAHRTQAASPQSDREEVYSVTEHGQRRSRGGVPNWACAQFTFAPPKDLSGKGALGVWICGDGKGELLNVQYSSPEHMVRGIADNYIPIDFTGWRYFELIEPEGERVEDYLWPYSGNAYLIYRELVHWNAISSLGLWLNNLPPSGEVSVYVSPIKAMSLVKAKLINPSLTINGHTITFPVELESGYYLEYNWPSGCKVYSPSGDLVSELAPVGSAKLQSGSNEISFSCRCSPSGIAPRARVTLGTVGECIQR